MINVNIKINGKEVSKEVQGNDLAVEYLFYNSFARANLENANF